MISEIPNQQILEGAKYYNQAHGMLDKSGSDCVLLPAIHCAAIAMELYLKSLCGQNIYTPSPFNRDVEVVTATSPHGHCLPSLYDNAPQDFHDKLNKEAFAIERLRSYLGQGPTEVAPDGFFRDVLDRLDGRLFTPSRYPYEAGKSVSGLPLDVISDILRVFSSVVR
jgi:hypothetical protein